MAVVESDLSHGRVTGHGRRAGARFWPLAWKRARTHTHTHTHTHAFQVKTSREPRQRRLDRLRQALASKATQARGGGGLRRGQARPPPPPPPGERGVRE